MTKRSVYTTMQLIADILSFKDNRDALSKQIKHTTVDWDGLVIVGSKQLMLPALYCRLKAKGLLELIPEELNFYLEEIADINRGRNEILASEVIELSEILKKENIDHVFIKGAALLAGETFNDPAERMIGDIDILVAESQLHNAFDLLTKQGYTNIVNTILEIKNRRHLPRQISQQKFGAIEIHGEILRHRKRDLIDVKSVLQNKRTVNGIAIPSIEDSIRMSILAFQINDKAHLYGHFGFKPIYDCLALQLQSKPLLLNNLCEEKHSQSFLKVSSIFFKELTPIKTSPYSLVLKHYYLFRLKHPKSGHLISSLVNTSINLQVRMNLLIYNPSYRRHILKNKFAINLK